MGKTKALLIILGFLMLTGEIVIGQEIAEEVEKPKVEVVFCLDTTGSMGGLIEGAKQKIWSIANQIIKGKPTPELNIGLVGYRDYGDIYVTKIHPLNDDLDIVFDNLMSFQADGGGDTPEHVNKALYDAVHGIHWSKESKTFKLIFLVGDCPPHMDYQDGYDYRTICQEAVKKDIIINTVQCGDYNETVRYWREIARLGEGKYATVPQSGGMRVIETPYDDELTRLNSMLEETVVAFGSETIRAKSDERVKKVREMAPEAAAERALYKSYEEKISTYDLIDALENNTVKLEKIKDKELPEEMRKMSLEEKREYLSKKEIERQRVKEKIKSLSDKRSAYISEKLKEAPEEDSFDEIVNDFIKKQAKKKGIRY